MSQLTYLVFALLVIAVVGSTFTKNNVENAVAEKDNDFAIAINGQTDLTQEGQSSDVIARAKRYYGCGCGCGCATVAAVTAAPCGYGCCGCGYGK